MTANTISNNKISNLVNSQVPFFVRNDHQNFVAFLEKYYEYLEQSSKAVNKIKNIQRYQDVDLTEDIFSEKLYEQFLKVLPKNILADKKLLIKHIKDFYRAKGTEKATRFLMNVLYNESINEFYYPKNDVLRASDGKWFVQKSLRVNDVVVGGLGIGTLDNSDATLEKFTKSKVTGAESFATAIVERVQKIYEFGTEIDELFLSNIDGDFINGEHIWTNFADENGQSQLLGANVFSGIINSILLNSPGSRYQVGDSLIIESNDAGSNASAFVSRVSRGNVATISVLSGGAGYRAGDIISITPEVGETGAGANAVISTVLLNNTVHPNSYNIVASTIDLETNTPINNTIYSNLVSSITDPANNWVANSMSYWVYGNTGPALITTVISPGTNYSKTPVLRIIANTTILSLGILGRMRIDNPGANYSVGDIIQFINVPGSFGTGANAIVSSVNGTGAITNVQFTAMPGHQVGGGGYRQVLLPTTNVFSFSGGTGGVITVESILGAGGELITTNTRIGAIEAITISSRGSGYLTAPTINLTQSGDGTATANATVLPGVFSYPGRYLNDDGHLSSYNFLQDRDFYQPFSYVIRSGISTEKYRQNIFDLTHPAGMKLFGEYQTVSENVATVSSTTSSLENPVLFKANLTFGKVANTVNVKYPSHGLFVGNTIYLEYRSGGYDNVRNGIYTVSFANTDYISVIQKASIANISIVNPGLRYNSNSFIVFSGGSGTGANATFTTNANGAIVSVTINDDGANYLTAPTATSNGTNAVSATFTVTLQYANNTTGNVDVGKISV